MTIHGNGAARGWTTADYEHYLARRRVLIRNEGCYHTLMGTSKESRARRPAPWAGQDGSPGFESLPKRPPREAWIDLAKGIAIVLVVLFHSVVYLSLVNMAGRWTVAAYTLDTFRMPLFFFMSGILATKVIGLPYAQLFRKRLLLLLYLYVVWVIAQTLFAMLIPVGGEENLIEPWRRVLGMFIWPNPNLWFIYALPIFFTIAWIARNVAPALQIGVASAVSVLFGIGWLHTDTPWDKMGRYLVFFVAAIYLGGSVRRIVGRVKWWHVVVLCTVYVGVILVLVKTPLVSFPFVLLAGSVVAVAVGISLAICLSRVRLFDFLRYLGTRTLPIYLFHTFPMVALAAILTATDVHLPAAVLFALPPLLTVVAILLSLGVYKLLRSVPGVYTAPIAGWTTTNLNGSTRSSPRPTELGSESKK